MTESLLRTRSSRWLLLIAWAVTIISLSLVPSPPTVNNPLLGWDKFQHGAAYALLTLLAGWASPGVSGSARRWLPAMAAAVLFGGIMELLQAALTKNRVAEWGDLLADAIGAGMIAGGAMVVTWLRAGNK